MPTDINTIQAWAAVISAIITALTGFFIVQTFILQAKVAQEQSKITRLEVEKSLKEKNPLFFATIVRVFPENYVSKDIVTTYEVEVRRNDIYSFRYKLTHFNDFTSSNFEFTLPPNGINKGLIEGTKLIIKRSVNRHLIQDFKRSGGDINKLAFGITFHYNDILRNDYTQDITFLFDLDPISFPPFIPQLWDKLDSVKVKH